MIKINFLISLYPDYMDAVTCYLINNKHLIYYINKYLSKLVNGIITILIILISKTI